MSACSARSLPGWADRVQAALEKGEADWLASTPRVAQILRGLGVKELEAEGLPRLSLGCCGEPLVAVNGGGLYSEGEWSPNTSQSYPVRPHRLDPSPLFEGAKCSDTPAYMSPLGWVNLSPLALDDEGASGCIEAGGLKFSRERMEPLNFYRADRVCRGISAGGDPGDMLGPFRLGGEWRPLAKSGSMLHGIISGLEAVADRSNGSLVLLGDGEIEISTPYYDTLLSILGPGTFYTLRAVRAGGEANAMSIGGPMGSLAIASKAGLEFWVEPGLVRLRVSGSARLMPGGALAAARLLHEDQAILAPTRLCRRGVGHMRVYNSIAILDSVSSSHLVIAAYSPVDNGRGEFRSYLPLRGAVVEDLAGTDEVPVSADIVRWPMPFGFCGSVRIRVGGTLFLRLGKNGGA